MTREYSVYFLLRHAETNLRWWVVEWESENAVYILITGDTRLEWSALRGAPW